MLDEVPGDEAIVKPVVGASAVGVVRLDRRAASDRAAEVETYFAERAVMAQPLARAVLEEGEYSLIYLNGVHSHTILKTPKAGDFRAQEEHGSVIRAAEAEASLLEAGRQALEALPEVPLYARADFVRSNDGASHWLMELELLEPSLYLRMDPGAPARFAAALDARAGQAR